MSDSVTVTENTQLCFFVPRRAGYGQMHQMYHLSASQMFNLLSVTADSGMLSGITQTDGISQTVVSRLV